VTGTGRKGNGRERKEETRSEGKGRKRKGEEGRAGKRGKGNGEEERDKEQEGRNERERKGWGRKERASTAEQRRKGSELQPRFHLIFVITLPACAKVTGSCIFCCFANTCAPSVVT